MKKGERMTEEQKAKISDKLKGHPVSEKTRKQLGSIWRGKHPPMEFKKGDAPHKHKLGCKCFRCNPKDDSEITGRVPVHKRMTKKYGQPRYCEHCKRTDQKKYDWANKDHKYTSVDVNLWMRLCSKCHARYDIKYNKKYAKAHSND